MKSTEKRIENVRYVEKKIIIGTEDTLIVMDWYLRTEVTLIGGTFITVASKRRAVTKAISRKILGTNGSLPIRQIN